MPGDADDLRHGPGGWQPVVLNRALQVGAVFYGTVAISGTISEVAAGSPPSNAIALIGTMLLMGWAAFSKRRSHSVRAATALGTTLGLGLIFIPFVGLNATVAGLLFGACMLALLTLGPAAAVFAISAASLGFVATAVAVGWFGWTPPDRPLNVVIALRGLMTFLAFGGGSVAAVHYIIQRLERTTRELGERTAALRRSEAEFRGLFEHVFEGVFRGSQDGRLLMANRALAEMLGYESPDELMRLDMGDLYVRAADREELRRRLARDGEIRHTEVTLKRKDGREIYALMNARAVRDEGGGVSYEGTLVDMTVRKQLEDQLVQAVKMEAVGRLAGGVAHDFNNLLTIILGYTDLLRDSPSVPGDERHHLESIRAAASSASDLTRQLLAFSRKQILAPQAVDVNAIVTKMLALLTRVLGEDVAVETRLADALETVHADPGQLEQVIMNLCVNARDAMASGGRLTIATGNVELSVDEAAHFDGLREGPHIVLTVTDTGIGMPEAVQARVFEPFFTTKEPSKGTGLGLATVYGIIRQSGGSISVASQPGAGTVFTIHLPRANVEALPSAPSLPASPGGSETILVVEDEQEVREIVNLFLSAEGYAVLQAASGIEALRICALNPRLDLVITDVIMPDMGGRELAAQLATSLPLVRVLMMSGYTDDAVLNRGGPEPGRAILTKPFTREGLLQAVRRVLDDVPTARPR